MTTSTEADAETIFYQGQVVRTKDALAPTSTDVEVLDDLVVTPIPVPQISPDMVGMAPGPDDSLWWCEAGLGRIGRRTKDGEIVHFQLHERPYGIQQMAMGADGAFWFTNFNGNKIGRITMDGEITQLQIPGEVVDVRAEMRKIGGASAEVWFNSFNMPIPSHCPMCIVRGPDDAIWFTELMGNCVTRVTVDGEFTRFPVPTPYAAPTGLRVGKEGELWIAYWYSPKIARMTLDGTFTEYDVPGEDGEVQAGLLPGPDGGVWFTQPRAGRIGKISSAGELTWFDVPGAKGRGLMGLFTGPDGGIWFSELAGSAIGRINDDETVTRYTLGAGTHPFGIVFDSTGVMWCGDKVRGRLLRVEFPQ
jgi:virginiamycin B lyase